MIPQSEGSANGTRTQQGGVSEAEKFSLHTTGCVRNEKAFSHTTGWRPKWKDGFHIQ